MIALLSTLFGWIIFPLVMLGIVTLALTGLGWVLSSLLPLSLFEATLISALMAIIFLGDYYHFLIRFFGLEFPAYPYFYDEG